MKAKELIGLLHGLEDFELKDCALTTEILDALEARPVVHGEWKDYPICDGFYQCSICGVLSNGKYYFCSNCGADMRGDNDV